MADFFCEYCGTKAQSVSQLTGSNCARHPDGAQKGKHKLYEGSEKPQYTCRYCGTKMASISSLTGSYCGRHPKGPQKGQHAPAL